MEQRPESRLALAAPPYEPDVEALLQAMMPKGAPVDPLRLFRLMARHLSLATAAHALGRFVLGREFPLDLHDRELVIDRVCARCGCEYEWAVHAAVYGGQAGLSPAAVAATVTGGPDAPVWSARDALLVRLVDELHDTAAVSDDLWAELAREWREDQLLALLLLAGWYHAIAFIANGARLAPEPWTSGFPPG